MSPPNVKTTFAVILNYKLKPNTTYKYLSLLYLKCVQETILKILNNLTCKTSTQFYYYGRIIHNLQHSNKNNMYIYTHI